MAVAVAGQMAATAAGGAAGMGADAIGNLLCTIFGPCIRNFANGIPHPTECGCIGAIFYYGGCHDHKKFNLIVELHELSGLPKGKKVFVAFKCGRFDATSQTAKETKGTALVQERLTLHVRQCDNSLEIILWKTGIITNDKLGSLELTVKADLIDKKFPKGAWYDFQKDGKVVGRVKMSFHWLDPNLPTGQSPLVQQALLLAQQEAEEKGEKLDVDFTEMTEKEKLVFYSKALEGPLEKLNPASNSWTPLYFKAVEVRGERWDWCFWDSKAACRAEENPKGTVPLLSISIVLPDRNDRHVLYVRKHDKQGAHDLFFRRVDRDRDMWSDGLYEFIEKFRTYLENHAAPEDTKKADKTGKGVKPPGRPAKKTKTKKCAHEPSTPRSRSPSADLSGIRRLQSPRRFSNGDATRATSPRSSCRMIEGVMYSGHSSGVDAEADDEKSEDSDDT